MMNRKAAPLSADDFTPEERMRMRALLKQDDRVTWLWSSLGVWIKWGLAFGTALVVAWEHLRDFCIWIANHFPK